MMKSKLRLVWHHTDADAHEHQPWVVVFDSDNSPYLL